MRRFALLVIVSTLVLVPPLRADSPGLEGTWFGELNLVVQKLRLGIQIKLDAEGKPSGVLDSLDQGAFGIPLTAIEREGNQVRIDVESLKVTYTAEISADGMRLSGTFTQNGLPLPLSMKRVDRYPTLNRPQQPKGPFPYAEEEVSYKSQKHNVTLAGTLTLPASPSPLPAVLLITGSGPQDRDEAIAGHRPFLVIADALSRAGIAVLRVDDRGVGGSSAGDQPATTADLANDVLAGVQYLADRPEIDSRRIGLVGHSEGGLIAPLAARHSDQVAWIVMLAGPGVPGARILITQGRLIGASMKRPEWLLDWNTAVQHDIFKIIEDHPDSESCRKRLTESLDGWIARVPEDRAFTRDTLRNDLARQIDMYTSAWFRYFLFHDPAPVLRQVPCPVLALFGERDLQVPAEENSLAVNQALAEGHNPHVTVRTFPRLNHLFQTATTGSPLEYGVIEETIDEEALRFMVQWIADQAGPAEVRLAERRRIRRRQQRRTRSTPADK